MSNLHNEEIRAIQTTIVALEKGIPLEPNQSKKNRMRENVKELKSILQQKLGECSDFNDIRIEEDIY